MSFKILKYKAEYFEIWNTFVSESKNGTFLFHRDFMQYHEDRFVDYSLLIFENEKLIAILPANIFNNEIFSHQGLTYGGVVVKNKLRTTTFNAIFKCILVFLENENISYLSIKKIPTFYTSQFSDELSYLQFILEAKIYRKDVCSVINLQEDYETSKSVKRDSKIAVNKGIYIDWNGSLDLFWNEILEPNLLKKFHKKPVHSLKEIMLLKEKFPNNIIQVNVMSQTNDIIAGTTLFVTKNVIHSQYISIINSTANVGVLDYLFLSVMNHFKNDKKYFDFGISNENEGKNINKGLFIWKEKFGARTAIQEFYKFETKNHTKLDTLYL